MGTLTTFDPLWTQALFPLVLSDGSFLAWEVSSHACIEHIPGHWKETLFSLQGSLLCATLSFPLPHPMNSTCLGLSDSQLHLLSAGSPLNSTSYPARTVLSQGCKLEQMNAGLMSFVSYLLGMTILCCLKITFLMWFLSNILSVSFSPRTLSHNWFFSLPSLLPNMIITLNRIHNICL